MFQWKCEQPPNESIMLRGNAFDTGDELMDRIMFNQTKVALCDGAPMPNWHSSTVERKNGNNA